MARKEGVVFLFCTEARRGAPTISAKRLASARARQQKNSDQGPFEILVLQNSLGQAGVRQGFEVRYEIALERWRERYLPVEGFYGPLIMGLWLFSLGKSP
jgi:hypothetical protein